MSDVVVNTLVGVVGVKVAWSAISVSEDNVCLYQPLHVVPLHQPVHVIRLHHPVHVVHMHQPVHGVHAFHPLIVSLC